MLEECIESSQDDENIYDYLKLTDRLLLLPQFHRFIQPILIRVYPMIVKALKKKGLQNEIEGAKITRKIWLGRISPILFQELRKVTFEKCKIDIDILTTFKAI